jgi:hypothetical protein
MTAKFLLNRIRLRILYMQSPCELLLGENKFVVHPKDRPLVSKLDLELLSASSLATLLDSEDINVGDHLSGAHL